MKNKFNLVLVLGSLFSFVCFGQGLDCDNYSTVGDDTSTYSQMTICVDDFTYESNIDSLIPWTGTSCTGKLVTTSNLGPVTCMNLIYGRVNSNDFGLLSTDTGGNLTIETINADVSGDTIGPFNCNPNFGDVAVKVCSDIPFTQLTLTNVGCTSGWVMHCGSGSFTSGFSNNIDLFEIEIYPNPTSGLIHLNIRNLNEEGRYEIIAMDGTTISSGSLNSSKTKLDLSGFSVGSYFVRVSVQSETVIRKIIIQ